MDRRRERVAGVPGTLWTGKNIHINRGGDIERRLPFVSIYNVPSTFGLAAVRSQLYVFGSADLAATMPVNVQYQRLVAPGSAVMTALLDVKTFSGKFYAIAEYDNGGVYHFYDGTRVTDWDVVGAANATFETVARVLADKIESAPGVQAKSFGSTVTVSALVAGTGFTISKSTTNGSGTNDQDITLTTVQANVAAVAEVVATADVTVTGGTAASGNAIRSLLINNVTELLSAYVTWSGSNAATAIRLAAEINRGFSSHGFSAVANNETVTINAAPGTGATLNGQDVFVTSYGDVETSFDATISGGVTEVAAVQQIVTAKLTGTVEAADTFAIIVNGETYQTTVLGSGTGRTAFVKDGRVWSPSGSLWNYSMYRRADIWDPANVTADNDAGFINISSEAEGNENLVVAARYQNLAALFSENNVVLYQTDADPANFAFSDILENTGTGSPKSVVRYGNNDVFYLDITGIRSLRARDSSNAPFVSDIGNAIDIFVNEYLKSLTRQQVVGAIGAIEPRDGRYWLIVGTYIIVLSYFPGAKISAWSYYDLAELDGAAVTAAIRNGAQTLIRAGDHILAYGGEDGDTLPEDDDVIAEVDHPFLSGETPATIKSITGFDIACRNTWACEIAMDPNDPERRVNVGNLSRTTFADAESINVPGETSMIAPKLTCSKGGAATLSMLAIHYETEKAA